METRITIDVRMAYASGIGVYIRNLVPRIMADWPDARFTLLASPQDKDRLSWAGTTADVQFVTAGIYSVRQQYELLRAIPRNTALFWSPHYDVPVFWRGRVLVTVHDVAHLALPALFPSLAKQAYARLMLQAVRRKADHIIFDSDFSRREFERLVGRPRGQQTVIYIGADDAWSDPRWGHMPSPQDGPYILYVGNVKPHKNLGGLIAAFRKLADRIPHNLVIVGQREGFITGDTGLADMLNGLEGRVRFTGYLADEEVKRLVAHAALLAMPSFYEGFGLPVLEAMAAGCPVASSRAASLPEVGGDAVVYFDPADSDDMAAAMMSIVSNAEVADGLRVRGRAQAARFRWDTTAVSLSGMIAQMLNG